MGLCAGAGCGAPDVPPESIPSAGPVATIVLVTMDGVRTREMFEGPVTALDDGSAPEGSAMPFLVHELIPRGTFIGAPGVDRTMRIGNPTATSLPVYQTLFVGRWTFCFRNDCSPPSSPTLFDRIRSAFELAREDIAVYVTWYELCSGTGLIEDTEAVCGADALFARWGERFEGERPPSMDQAGIDLAVARLRRAPPRVLYLALDEPDGTAHAGAYWAYLASLRRADEGLRRIDAEVTRLEAAGHPTVLIVTTDHGRGRGEQWTEHGWRVPGSDETWLFVRGAGLPPRGAVASARAYTLRDVRPTIEHLLGLEPTSGPGRGSVIEDLFVRDSRADASP